METKEIMYTVRFYSKYSFDTYIAITDVSEEHCKIIQRLFDTNLKHKVLNKNIGEVDKKMQSQIDLNCVSYIQYIKQE